MFHILQTVFGEHAQSKVVHVQMLNTSDRFTKSKAQWDALNGWWLLLASYCTLLSAVDMSQYSLCLMNKN